MSSPADKKFEASLNHLASMADHSCKETLDKCLELHSKVEVLRNSLFKLDDLVFSIGSCWYELLLCLFLIYYF